MALIGGSRSDLSITRMTREILETFPRVFCVSTKTVLMETLKKVVEADRCLICSTAVAKKEKLYVFGESSIDFCEIIKSTPY